MDTACLMLKFNPLTQSIKGSKSTCCLEIVPEISCIENFDKLNWQNKSEVIEYTIPLTYTITLKKSAFKEYKDYSMNSNKVYHSCVDILKNNSLCDFECGDVHRMISDNQMIYHYLNKQVTKENKTRLGVKEENSELLAVYIEDPNSSNQSVISNEIECVCAETNDTSTNKLDSKTKHVCKESVMRISSASTNIAQNITEFSDGDMIRNSSTETDNFNIERKLTLSPICSVSTEEHDSPPVLKDYNKNNEIIESVVFSKPIPDLKNEIYFGIQQYRVFDIIKKPNHGIEARVNNRNRMSNEAKFEYFMRMMEKELQPVNMLFNDIVDKCITLGIHDKIINKKQKAIGFKFASTCKEEVLKCCTFDNMFKSKSNRVVYTVICDG